MQDLKKHKFVVVGGDNINSLGVIRSLGEVGLAPEMIMVNKKTPSFVLNSRYLKKVYFSSSISESVDLLVAIYGEEENKTFVYTTDDNHEQLLDVQYEELKNKFYFFNAGESGRITTYMDKMLLCNLAKECGLNIPKSEVVVPGVLPKTLRYPIITKTINSYSPGWKKDVYICYTENELLEAYKSMESPALIVQEYIEKENELEIHGLSINGGEQVKLFYSSLYYRFQKDNFGFYKYYQVVSNIELINKVSSMIKKIGYTGCFEVEFLISKGVLFFLEINFRFALSNYACTYAKVNLPLFWANSILANKIQEVTLSSKMFSAMCEPGDFSQYVATKKISYLQWFKEMYKADLKFLYNKKDKKPAIKYWCHVIKEVIRFKLFHK